MQITRRQFNTLAILPLSLGLWLPAVAAPAFAPGDKTTWVLRAYGERGKLTRVLPGKEVTLIIDGAQGRLGGSSGCNSYGAPFKASSGRLAVGPVAATKKFCNEPDGLMTQESRFFELLQAADRYQIRGRRLILSTAKGQILRFRAQ